MNWTTNLSWFLTGMIWMGAIASCFIENCEVQQEFRCAMWILLGANLILLFYVIWKYKHD